MSLIYLDNSATSFPKAPGVAEAVSQALLTSGTSGRASYDEALSGSRILYNCRRNLAELLSVKERRNIILNSGTTESINTVLKGFLKPGMKVLTSSTEHNAVMRPLNALKQQGFINYDRFGNCEDGTVNLENVKQELKKKPDLLICTHSSNVTGAIYPIKGITALAHQYGVPVCIDGAQTLGHEPVNLSDLNVDFYCFSGHKGLLGPGGTGGFYLKDEASLRPLMEGGTGSQSEEEIQPDFLPDAFESGTRNISGLAGLTRSVEFILEEGIEKIARMEKSLTENLINGLNDIDGIIIYGPLKAPRNSVVSFTHNRIELSQLAEELEEAGLAFRMGLHCAPSAHKVLGTFDAGGTIRLSPGYFNSHKEIEMTIKIIQKVCHGR